MCRRKKRTLVGSLVCLWQCPWQIIFQGVGVREMEKAYIVIYSAAQISEVQETVLKQNEVVHNVITDNEYQNKMEITFVILMGY